MRIKQVMTQSVMGIIAGALGACTVQHDLAYYRTHPQAVFEALQACDVSTHEKHCQQLQALGRSFRQWANDVKLNAQAYGQTIIALQQECVKPSLTAAAKETCRQEVEMRLAVVRWLESPEN